MKKNCAHCGREFEAQRSNAKYCRQSCRTSASYKRNGYVYRQGHYEKPGEKKEQNLPVPSTPSALPTPQGMGSIEAGRAKDVVSMGGTVESFIGASASHLVAHQLTKGEYKADFARISAAQKFSIYLLQNLYKALNIPLPPAPNLVKKPIGAGDKSKSMKR